MGPNPDEFYKRFVNNITLEPDQRLTPGTPIPQRPYCQGAVIQGGAAGQIIMFATADGSPFPAESALAGQCDLLVDANGTVFPDHNQTINMRIEWPGYEGWGAQIRIVNYQGQPPGITRAKLVREVAKQLRNFIEKMKPAPIDPALASYNVAPGGIELRHIRIATLEQVSRGSWQPRLIYSG